MRAELKYIVPNALLPALREALTPFVELDRHGVGYEERGYTVRSIYLDSPSLRYYHEKQQHLQHRKKLRIRGYNAPRDGTVVFLEIKRKMDDAIGKDRARVRYDGLAAMLASGAYDPREARCGVDDAVAGRQFLYHVYQDRLGPVNLVVYEREAFQGLFDPTLRITLDRNLRGALHPGLDGLFREDGFVDALPGSFIMEIKYDTRFPAWMRPVIARFGLLQRAASKYCLCLDLFERRPCTKGGMLAHVRPILAMDAPGDAPEGRSREEAHVDDEVPVNP